MHEEEIIKNISTAFTTIRELCEKLKESKYHEFVPHQGTDSKYDLQFVLEVDLPEAEKGVKRVTDTLLREKKYILTEIERKYTK